VGRGRGLNLALAAGSYLAMIERGYRSASYTWSSTTAGARDTRPTSGARVTRNFNGYRTDFHPSVANR